MKKPEGPNPISSVPQYSLRSVLLCSLPALLLSAVCLLPYLNKAFTIDDPFFLFEAQQVLKTPLHPTALSICWVYDATCAPVAHTMFLMAYVLAPLLNSSAPEVLAHLIQIAALWCAIAATVSLAFRLGLGTFAAAASGLLVAASPPVLAMASTAMPDILAMSLGVIGIERLMAWKTGGKLTAGFASALGLGLAPIARVHLVFLWVIGALLLREDARIFDLRSWIAVPRRRWLPLIAAAFVMWGILKLTEDPAGQISATPLIMKPEQAFRNLQSYCLDWILAMPLGIPWLLLRNRRIKLWILLPLLAFGCVLPLVGAGEHSAYKFLTSLCAGLGAFVLIDVLVLSYQSRHSWHTACALWLLVPLVAVPYIDFPVKFLVMCAPAVALLVADQLSGVSWRRAALVGTVAAGAIFSSLVLYADANFAEMGRQAAARLVAPYAARGARVWVSSQWGFDWYALEAGAQVLRPGDAPARGDFLVRGAIEGYAETLPRLHPSALADVLVFGGPGGRTMSLADGAGLYDNGRGDLMWAWGTGEVDRYELWQFR